MSTRSDLYEHQLQGHRDSALSTLRWVESRIAEIREGLGEGGSTVHAVGAARTAAGEIADLSISLARIQTLEEWRFLAQGEGGTR
ncbi:hypothetical protein ACFHW2_12075 [Actinomadura sp. LOL_016]|uniref:hypothetical protein n=1 Tax=unclassified Actinomadura TaxID=2626254 RepID=UPI003A80364D